MRGTLDGIRVLDLTAEPGFLAGKLLAEMGADVVKVEPPGGDPARRRPPFWGGVEDPERAILWLALNTSKRSLTLALDHPRGRALFLDLVARADVVLETAPPGTLDWAALHARNRRLVLCSITPFGQTGPYAGWRGSDLTVTAMTGNRGARSGAMMRQGRSVQREIWPCKDGFVSFALRGGPARIPGLVAMVRYMDEHGMASERLKAMDWTRYNHNLLSQEEVDALSAEFGAFFRTKTMAELYAAACERNLMLAPINTPREMLASAQLADRGFFVDLEHPGRGRLTLPGAFARTTPASVAVRGPAPRLGEHTAAVLGEIGVDAAALARLRAEGVV